MQGESSCKLTNTSHLSFLLFNVRSLLPKIDELRIICASSNPDVVCVVETWLCDSISDCELSIPGHCITRFDRNRHGAWWASFLYQVTLFTEVLLSCPNDLEFALLSVVNWFQVFLIKCMYRPFLSSPQCTYRHSRLIVFFITGCKCT